MHGDGTTRAGAPSREDTRTWTLTVPDAARALRDPSDENGPQRVTQGAEKASRRIVRVTGLAAVVAALVALTVPVTRTVELAGQLVPERVVSVRASEPGLLAEIHVAAGDTVRPGQPLARLRSPQLDEATRASTGHDPALLARRVRLDVSAPPSAERQPDGAADASTLWHGGVVLTEDLRERRGARLDAGDTVLDLAAVDAAGRVPLVVRAWADEREALRARPGMPARLTFTAIPHERLRQASGTVRRVALAPEADVRTGAAGETRWRVEVDVDPDAVATVVGAAETPTELRAGFTVEISVEERRETLVVTARRWFRARAQERRPSSREGA